MGASAGVRAREVGPYVGNDVVVKGIGADLAQHLNVGLVVEVAVPQDVKVEPGREGEENFPLQLLPAPPPFFFFRCLNSPRKHAGKDGRRRQALNLAACGSRKKIGGRSAGGGGRGGRRIARSEDSELVVSKRTLALLEEVLVAQGRDAEGVAQDQQLEASYRNKVRAQECSTHLQRLYPRFS